MIVRYIKIYIDSIVDYGFLSIKHDIPFELQAS